MADFMSNLWEAVFTPGTTPTLLLATNVTFACLQLTLAALLVATFSIHFVILSFLCGGLWWAINWFAYELQQAQQAQEKEAQVDLGAGVKVDVAEADTEFKPTPADEQIKSQVLDDLSKSGLATSASASTTGLQPPDGASRHRNTPSDLSASSAEFGTDSEWIKVDEE